MTPERREQFRIFLLLAVAKAAGFMTLTSMDVACRMAGFAEPTADIKRELEYLQDKKFIATKDKALSPESKAWRITAEGRDWLASEGYEP